MERLVVLSNSQRQKKFRDRIRQQAAEGVTPDMIVKAGRIFYEMLKVEAGDTDRSPDYEEMLALARKHRGQGGWVDWSDTLPHYRQDDDLSAFGADADLIRKVSAVVRAIRYPPES